MFVCLKSFMKPKYLERHEMSEIAASLSMVVKGAKDLLLSMINYKESLSAAGTTQNKTRYKLTFLI